MKSYDRTLPLIFIHIPKMGGTSVKTIFKKWYGDGLLEHYSNEIKNGTLLPSVLEGTLPSSLMPAKHDLFALHTAAKPVVVYGHFNRSRGFGIEHYYPDVKQFITILRDPFETAISAYYWRRTHSTTWQDQTLVTKNNLREFLKTYSPNILHHFPRQVTKENYREQIEEFFIEMGVLEHLTESMRRIAAALNFPFEPQWIPHENAITRDEEYPRDLRKEYMDKFPLEFEVYDYVADTLHKTE